MGINHVPLATQPISGTVDTEIAVAVAGADVMANPTIPQIFGLGLVFNGTAWDRLRTPNVFKPLSAVTITTETTIWTPTAGKKFRLMGIHFRPSAAMDVTLRDNTAGTIIAIVGAGSATATPSNVLFGNGILSGAADRVLTAIGSAAGTISGTIFGTEE